MAAAAVEAAEVKYISTMPQDSKIRVREIKRVILEEEARVRRQYPILNHQVRVSSAASPFFGVPIFFSFFPLIFSLFSHFFSYLFFFVFIHSLVA